MKRSATRIGLIIGIPLALLFGAYGVARAFNSSGWTSGETLKAADLNTLVARINSLESQVALPTGTVLPYAGVNAPSGFLLCDGSAVSRTTYAALFTVIGTTYGAGDNTTTFNLPDLRGRAPIGVGQGSGLTNRVLGASGGEETHTLTTAEMPSHTHAFNTATNLFGQGGSLSTGFTGGSLYGPHTDYASPSISATGDGGAHNNMQPFIALNFIIAI